MLRAARGGATNRGERCCQRHAAVVRAAAGCATTVSHRQLHRIRKGWPSAAHDGTPCCTSCCSKRLLFFWHDASAPPASAKGDVGASRRRWKGWSVLQVERQGEVCGGEGPRISGCAVFRMRLGKEKKEEGEDDDPSRRSDGHAGSHWTVRDAGDRGGRSARSLDKSSRLIASSPRRLPRQFCLCTEICSA